MELREPWGGINRPCRPGKLGSPAVSFSVFISYWHTFAFWGWGKWYKADARYLSFKMSPLGRTQQTQRKYSDTLQPCSCAPRCFSWPVETGWSNRLLRNVGFQGHLTQQGGISMVVQGLDWLRFLPSEINQESTSEANIFWWAWCHMLTPSAWKSETGAS